MKKIAKVASFLSTASLLLSVGVVGAQSGTIDNTGPSSDNQVLIKNDADYNIENKTNVKANIDVDQDATSGDAKSQYNTHAGDAATGDVSNANTISASVSVDNSNATDLPGSSCACVGSGMGTGSIDTTGPHSDNNVKIYNNLDVDVSNKVDTHLDVDIDQDARSGDATVSGNTSGGSATTGSASNTSSTSFSLSVTN